MSKGLLLCFTVMVAFAAWSSAQVGAPNPQGPNAVVHGKTIIRTADGRMLLRGSVQMSITGPVDLRADEIEVSADGREVILRNNVTARIPAGAFPAPPARP